MSPEKITISNVPNIRDVNKLITLLKGLGVQVEQIRPDTWTFQADKVNLDYLSSDEFRQNAGHIRGSVMLMGALLARFGRAYLPKPGGDKIGRRRMDTHFLGFQKLGVRT